MKISQEQDHKLSPGNPIYSILYIDGDVKRLADFEAGFRKNFHIYTARLGREAMEIMGQRTIQLVIADRKLPDIAGIGLLLNIMSEYPACTRIIQTEDGPGDEVMTAVDRGIIFQYISVPWRYEDLKITMEGAMELYFLRNQNKYLEEQLQEVKETLEKKVMDRTRQIEWQRENITDSIHYASRIQKALMLPPLELDELMPQHFLFHKPKDIVSGDFYWVSRKGERLIIAVVDCTGHGVAGAFMSILGVSLLNEIVGMMEEPETNRILDALRTRVIAALGQTGRADEAREGMEMALCIVDFNAGSIQFSGASRPLYLVRKGKLLEVRGDRMPIGIYHEEEVPFSSQEIHFMENDLIYMFTDGYSDQLGGLKRRTFKSGRFRKLLCEIWDRPMDEQKAILREEHEIWRAGQEQIDDIMVMGVKLTRS